MKNRTIIKQKSTKYAILKTSIWVFLSMPFLFSIYLYLTSLVSNTSISNLILGSPMMTIILIISMINPFCGFICKQAVEDLESNKYGESIRFNLILLALSQLIIFNIFGFLMLLLSLISSFKWRGINLKNAIKSIDKAYLIKRLSLSIVVLFISSICFLLMQSIK